MTATPHQILTTGRLRPHSLFVETPAERYLDQLVESEGIEQLRIAEQIVELDPGCTRARLVLAKNANTAADRVFHLEWAVQAGEALWARIADEFPNLDWYAQVQTRHYLRAVAQLGDAYVEIGDTDGAKACYTRCLAMNPADDMEVGNELRRLGEEGHFRPRR